MFRSLFSQLENEWHVFSKRPESTAALQQWVEISPVFDGFERLSAVIDFLRAPGGHRAKDDVLAALAERAPTDTIAARALLQAVLYALLPLANRYQHCLGGFEESAALVVGVAYERIRTYPFERRPRRIAANIVLDTMQRVVATIEQLPDPGEPLSAIRADEAPPAEPLPSATLTELVGCAVRRGRVTREDARLILLTRVFDVPAAELAPEYNCQAHSLRRRRLRAERALRVLADGLGAT